MKPLPVNPQVARAVEVAEKRLGTQELSVRLGVPDSNLSAWRLGQAAMPEHKFLQLVDILTELDISWSEWNP